MLTSSVVESIQDTLNEWRWGISLI